MKKVTRISVEKLSFSVVVDSVEGLAFWTAFVIARGEVPQYSIIH